MVCLACHPRGFSNKDLGSLFRVLASVLVSEALTHMVPSSSRGTSLWGDEVQGFSWIVGKKVKF